MRVAVLVLGIIFPLLFMPASCVGLIARSSGLGNAFFSGIILTPFWFIGAAFALGKPKVSTVLFGIATALALILSWPMLSSLIWGVPSLALAVLSYFGQKELRDKRAREARPVEVNVHVTPPAE